MQKILPNHAYINLSQVEWPGPDDTNSSSTIVCHTDLDECCRGDGDWFFPNGNALPGAGLDNNNRNFIAIRRLNQRIRLQRGPVSNDDIPIPSGIYRCNIPTGDGEEFLYVGIYDHESGGMYNIVV